MSTAEDPALNAAQRIADGLDVDLNALASADPELARGLRRLAALAQALQPRIGDGPSWGPLRDLRPAGAGTFGEVFRAFDPALDRDVALKLRRDDAPSMLPSGRDFVAEARRLARVRHPHVLAVHGASYHDGRAGLWTDWIDGRTLSDHIGAHGALDPAALLRLAREIAAALRAVHAAGLVHGDVKTSNVMLDDDGHALLTDFGAGFEQVEGGSPMTAGTPRYLPPEIARGETGTTAVDLYAFGVLLHRAATDRYPDAAAGSNARIRPRALRILIQRLMHDDPARRPLASEVEAILARIADAPRRRAHQLALSAVIAGLVAIALVSVLAYRRAEALRHEAVVSRDQALAANAFLTDLLNAPAPEASGREVTVAELLDAAAIGARSAEDLSPPVRVGLLATIGGAYASLMHLRQSDEVLTEALTLDAAPGGLDDEAALRLRLRLSDVRANREHYEEAEAVLAAALQDPRWRDRALARKRIAIQQAENLLSAGKADAAAARLREEWLVQTDLAPLERAHLGWVFGRLYAATARNADAERVMRDAIALADTQGHRGQVEGIWLRNQLAIALVQQARSSDAVPVLRAVLRQVEATYGEHRLSRVVIGNNLAIAVRELGRFAESEQLARGFLAEAIAIDGERSSGAMHLRSTLAGTLLESGQYPAAMEVLDPLIAVEQSELGADNPQTLLDRFNRVEALNYLGDSDRALNDGRALLTEMVAKFGADHPFTLETRDAIGFALTAVGLPVEAEAVHRDVLVRKSRVLGADNPYTLLTEEYLARALFAQHRFAETRAVVERLAGRSEKVLGVGHRRTLRVRELLGHLPVQRAAAAS